MTAVVAVTAPRRMVDGRERVTLTSAPWTLAVQWHPEDLTGRALFDGFARAVA